MLAFVMPFGKHRGKKLADVPSDYLRWVVAKAEMADGTIKALANEELKRRGGVPHTDILAEYELLRSIVHDGMLDHATLLAITRAEAYRAGQEDMKARIIVAVGPLWPHVIAAIEALEVKESP